MPQGHLASSGEYPGEQYRNRRARGDHGDGGHDGEAVHLSIAGPGRDRDSAADQSDGLEAESPGQYRCRSPARQQSPQREGEQRGRQQLRDQHRRRFVDAAAVVRDDRDRDPGPEFRGGEERIRRCQNHHTGAQSGPRVPRSDRHAHRIGLDDRRTEAMARSPANILVDGKSGMWKENLSADGAHSRTTTQYSATHISPYLS